MIFSRTLSFFYVRFSLFLSLSLSVPMSADFLDYNGEWRDIVATKRTLRPRNTRPIRVDPDVCLTTSYEKGTKLVE